MVREVNKDEFKESEAWSYSRLSLFVKDKLLYKAKYVDNQPIKQVTTKAMIMGSLIDLLLCNPEDLQEEFIIRPYTVPKPQLKKYTEYLVECYVNPSILGEETAEEYAYRKAEVKGSTLSKIKEAFNKDCLDYYNVLIESLEKPIITPNDLNKANFVVNTLKADDGLKEILSYDKQKMFINDELGFKIKTDFVGKEIIDLKIVTNSPLDFQNNIRMFNYDIQERLYSKTLDKDFKFLVVNAEYPQHFVFWKFSEEDKIKSWEKILQIKKEILIRTKEDNWYMPLEGNTLETNLYGDNR